MADCMEEEADSSGRHTLPVMQGRPDQRVVGDRNQPQIVGGAPLCVRCRGLTMRG